MEENNSGLICQLKTENELLRSDNDDIVYKYSKLLEESEQFEKSLESYYKKIEGLEIDLEQEKKITRELEPLKVENQELKEKNEGFKEKIKKFKRVFEYMYRIIRFIGKNLSKKDVKILELEEKNEE